ncbi:hypothetical protein G6O67_006215 [Ophiocordyceps sinensis]|uniref:FAD-binding PCMH-type domain-containing protein n=1 Tax=Ophiocordyceps sinensis TaxID=72228 RepID=A0A8H4PMI5_9HYPO|nr:hypothetical protein G6O67_006215 [Ophiocordyceps sinensis]
MRFISLSLALQAVWPACLAADDNGAIRACHVLERMLPLGVHHRNTTSYIGHNRYWSNRQGELYPHCFVTPRSTQHVSRIMGYLTGGMVPFAVKAGGHTAFEGGSNIDAGVTVDLVHLDSIAVSQDGGTVSVGPGNRWIDVSETLDPMGLAVVGGRAADVGVSGLLLGGGLSYFSGTRGWACDNVRSYQVVVSSGQIVDASPDENPDLYWALRGGGGSNFGIVTRFDLVAFPQRELWANSIIFPGELNKTLIPLFTDLTNRGLVETPEAHAYFVLGYQARSGGFIALTSLFQSTPPPRNTTPPVFQPFQSVPGAISNVTQLTSVSAQSRAINQPSGSRQTWWDASVDTTSTELFEAIVSLYEACVNELLAAADGAEIMPHLVFQPISRNVMQEMQKNGGNALGLKLEHGPLMIVQLTMTWSDRQLDALVEKSSEAFVGQVEELSKKMGLYRGFVYMNYAGKSQDVLGRYGRESYDRLTKTAAKWDPKGVLQELWRGYFQLQGPRGSA